MDQPRVILCFPNQDYNSFVELHRRWRYPNIKPRPNPMISLGMLYLVSNIRDICKVEYIDNNVHKLSTKDLTTYIKNENPDIVGFGGTLTEWTQAKDVAALLPPNIVTIYGGPNASANPVKHIKYFDYVLRGWAEDSLRQMILDYKAGKLIPKDIPGLCCGDFVQSPALKIDLDSLNYPARNTVDLNWYKRENRAVSSPVDIVVASRGCPFNCKFCSSKSIWDRMYKKRSVEAVINEIKYMRHLYKTKTIHFREDNLTVDRNYLEQLCNRIQRLNISWICQSRVDVLDRVTVKMMKAAGCKIICCGFESANDETLQYINKGFNFKQIVDMIQIFEEEEIHYSGGFMVGLLNEGEDEIKNTLNFVKKVSQLPYSLIPRGAGRFVGWPTSEMYNEIIENDLIAYNWQKDEMLIPHTYQLSAKKVEEIIYKYW